MWGDGLLHALARLLAAFAYAFAQILACFAGMTVRDFLAEVLTAFGEVFTCGLKSAAGGLLQGTPILSAVSESMW